MNAIEHAKTLIDEKNKEMEASKNDLYQKKCTAIDSFISLIKNDSELSEKLTIRQDDDRSKCAIGFAGNYALVTTHENWSWMEDAPHIFGSETTHYETFSTPQIQFNRNGNDWSVDKRFYFMTPESAFEKMTIEIAKRIMKSPIDYSDEIFRDGRWCSEDDQRYLKKLMKKGGGFSSWFFAALVILIFSYLAYR